jgi:hypothetical protein
VLSAGQGVPAAACWLVLLLVVLLLPAFKAALIAAFWEPAASVLLVFECRWTCTSGSLQRPAVLSVAW